MEQRFCGHKWHTEYIMLPEDILELLLLMLVVLAVFATFGYPQ